MALSPADRVDVAVVGGGLAALSAAWHLRTEHGVERVALIAGSIAAHEGFVVQDGLMDHASRVAEGIGRDAAAAIVAYTQDGVRTAARLARDVSVAVAETGSYKLAAYPAEQRDLEATAALLLEAGLPGRLVDRPLDGRAGRPCAPVALFNPHDVVLDARALCERLCAELAARGVDVRLGECAAEVRAEPDAAVVLGERGARWESEVCVIACGPAAPRVHRFFEGRLDPVRAQGFVARMPKDLEPLLAAPATAAWGHESYAVVGGSLIAAGLRPDPGADDIGYGTEPTPGFQRFLGAFARQRMPRLPEDLTVARAFAGPIALPADGLPLVGALPGCSRLIAAAGFGFRGLALAAAAGRSAARLAATGQTDAPLVLSPRRFV